MEQVVAERPFFEDPHLKQQRTSINGTLGVVGSQFQDLSHGWYPKRQTSLSKTPSPMSFLGNNRPLQLKGKTLACDEFRQGNSSQQTEYQHCKPSGHNGSKLLTCRYFIQGKCTYGAYCKFQHSNKDGDAEMKIVSTPGESDKTETIKTDSRKKKRRRTKHPADAMKNETTDPATQSASKISGEAEIGQGDVFKQVEQETCEISTSAGKNTINAEVIVSDSTVSCDKNHTSSVVSVLNKNDDAEMKVVSTPGESDKTVAVTKSSRKRNRKRAKRLADALKKESIDPATQSASESLGGCLDSNILILNHRSEAEIGQGDVMKEAKQDGERFAMETCAASTSAVKIAANADVIVSDSTVSCEKNQTLPVVSLLSKDSDAEMKIVLTPGENEETEVVKAKSRKRKRKRAKHLADAVKKETIDPATQGASESAGCSILNQRSEAEIGQGDVMKEVKQDGKGFVMETCAVSASAGKIDVNPEVIVSDSTVSCEKNHTLPVVSVLSKDSDAEMRIVSTPGEDDKTEAVKPKSKKRKRKGAKHLADAVKKETIEPATQGASKSAGGSILNQMSEAEIGQGDLMKQVKQDVEGLVTETCEISTSAGKSVNAEVIVSGLAVSCGKNHTSPVVSVLSKDTDAEMKIVSTPGENEKTEAVKAKSRKWKRKCAKRLADDVKKETIDPETEGASKSAGGSILNQMSEAEIGQGDLMKQVKQDVEGLVTETCEVSTSAGKSVVNAEVIVSEAAVSCEKNHTSPAVSVLNKDCDVEMKFVSIIGESEKTEAVKTNSKKKKKRCSKRRAAAMNQETTDPATQRASKIPLDSLDSSISILNHRSEAEIGPGDIMRQVKQDGEELVMIETGETSSAGKNSINAVVVSDSAISCEKNPTSPVVSVLNEGSDLGGSEKSEAVKTKSRKRKTKRSKCPIVIMEKGTTDPATQIASKSLSGCVDSNISALNPRTEAEILQGDIVMKLIKQDGEGLVTEPCDVSTSGKSAINPEVIVSDSSVSCEKSHGNFSVTGASADLSVINHPVQRHEQKNEVLTSDIQKNNQPTLPILQDEPVRINDSGCCSMQISDSLSRTPTLVSKRKLLVLDMNGLLVDVSWTTSRGPKPDIMVSKKGVFKRPFCDDFLKFCFERFDVGVWSSRVRVNLDQIVDFVMGDSRKRLLFCWDQSHCTRTGHNTLENRRKPLVLKELSKLWGKQVKDLPWEIGYYNETNTVLLDDSPYKALRNPPNTAIFVHPYSCTMVGDRSLGPDGDLRKYLIRLSEAENVQKFIEENPFGQDPITRTSKEWGFYSRIAKPTR